MFRAVSSPAVELQVTVPREYTDGHKPVASLDARAEAAVEIARAVTEAPSTVEAT